MLYKKRTDYASLSTDEEKYKFIQEQSKRMLHYCGFLGGRCMNLLCPDNEKDMSMSFYIASAGNLTNIRCFDSDLPLGGYSSEELDDAAWYCEVIRDIWDLSKNPHARAVFTSFINGNYTPYEAISLMEKEGMPHTVRTALSGVPIEDIYA